MAAKKSPSKAAAKKAPAKAAKKAAAPAPKKAAAAAAEPKAAAKKLPAGKTSPAATKPAPAAPKKAPESKAQAAIPATTKPAKKEAPVQKAAAPEPKKPEIVEAAKAAAPAPAPVKKVAPVKGKSSVVDFPAPPAPIKPPFVPPKSSPTKSSEPIATGANGSHPPAFIAKQKQRLLDLRDDLVDAMSGMTRDTIRNAPEGSEASGSGMHQGDAGSDAYDRDFALSVLAKEQDALYEIEQALRRIQSGTYGVCEISLRKIPQARLEVIPFARLTVEEQAQWEKEYGNRRFRPSNEVGFSGGNTSDDEDSETVSLDEDDD
jgi:RNA polymerase-binding transcription factor DksA